MVSALDEAVGNITSVLKDRGFLNNTLIVFTADVSMTPTSKLTLKAPRKKMHLKMSSAEVVCCK